MTPIPQRMLIASQELGPRLGAERVGRAIAAGFVHAGRPHPDVLSLAAWLTPEDVREQLDAAGFERRLRSARAVVIACARLHERALSGSPAFEIATRARQAGVPAYAVTGHDELNAFDARILDLQLVLQARSAKTLTAAGRRLAQL